MPPVSLSGDRLMPLAGFKTPFDVLANAWGFRARPADDEQARREGLLLRRDGAWLTLVDPRARVNPANPLAAGPGLWRWVRRAGGRAERVFEIAPLSGGMVDDPEAELADSLDATDLGRRMVDWALATRDGSFAPRAGAVPPPAAPLVARAGEHVVRGVWDVGGERVAIVFPHLVELPSGLPESRRGWIREICQASQDRWRWVRFGVGSAESPGSDVAGSAAIWVHAHVDLSGAPAPLASGVSVIAAACLQASVVWALPGLRAASDLQVESSVLGQPPNPSWAPERASAPPIPGETALPSHRVEPGGTTRPIP